MNVSQQLPLAVQLPDDEIFATFVGEHNQSLVALLRRFAEPAAVPMAPSERLAFLWGSSGSGKSHLLHSLCAAQTSQSVMYLSLREDDILQQPALLEGLDSYALVCLDDIDHACAREDWCFALFALINRVLDNGVSRLIMTAGQSSANLTVALADLQSRLQWGIQCHVQPLDDEQKAAALQRRAVQRGLQLNADVASFMVQRLGRNMKQLMAHLAELDRASMAAQRRLTIPFVKRVLAI
ncbi:DnaA regulatory inactivator Hda [Idiomarina xiamenensis]|uniref:DNA replication initiation ATPase n=1 Tax=Idiomarina xiamenensis 10-D-4 TaxID=740709 RepID=K2LAJ9_9GAMM|nr:DnaA regulatory inactivator Hda [Idiomarina xiamenensis]EKE86855.1 DNA replication initiation ATPase [Idiomarina xiamenensis 10-D-4]